MSNQAKRLTKNMTAAEKKAYEVAKEMYQEAQRVNGLRSNHLVKSILKDEYNYLD